MGYACFAKVMSDVGIDARTHDKTTCKVWLCGTLARSDYWNWHGCVTRVLHENSAWEKLVWSHDKYMALCMGTHDRLGAHSPIHCLTPCLLMQIYTMVYKDQYTQAVLKVWHEERRVAWRNHNHLDDCWAYCA
jgi:hypothetical protein